MTKACPQAPPQRIVNVLLISQFDEDHRNLREIEFLRDNVTPVAICESELPDGTWTDVLTQLARMKSHRSWWSVLDWRTRRCGPKYSAWVDTTSGQTIKHEGSNLSSGFAWLLWKGQWEWATQYAGAIYNKHRLEISPMNPNRAILAIGDEDWPFPVPIVRTKGKWSFDASETPVEMHARRIGTHELDAIEICHAYVDAQLKYASEDRDNDGMLEYAPHLMSTPGRHDGLYWEGAGEPLVPEGLAQAAREGARKGSAKPYHGYYFRVLQGQGSHAPEGAHNYFVKNKLIGRFGLVAWPSEYGVIGIHTFIVNQDGVVYEKDIAPVPGKPAPPITRFDPDDSWQTVD